MAAGNELGIHMNAPYISTMSYYLSDAYATENPKFQYYANVFPRIRMLGGSAISDPASIYPNVAAQADQVWALHLKNYNPNVYIMYGCATNPIFKPRYYSALTTYTLAAAAWAQTNGMDCFCIGNENLISSVHGTTHGQVATLSRTSNVVTATFAFDHGFTTGDYIFVYGATPSDMNIADSFTAETVQCTVTGATTLTYPATGANGSATGTIYVDWSAREVVRKTKALAVLVQAVFTRGPVEYTESQGKFAPWISLGITPGTDLDLIGLNAYGAGNDEAAYTAWKSEVDTDFATFGTNLIITEMNVVQEAPDTRTVGGLIYTQKGFDKTASTELIRRYNYAKDLGITQIYLFGPNGNGINWWMAFNFLCNTSPYGWNDGTKRQIVGNLMPVIKELKGERPTHVFFGNCGNI